MTTAGSDELVSEPATGPIDGTGPSSGRASPADPESVDAAFGAAWLAATDVEGWLSHDQAARLFVAARAVPPGGRIVEIGSYHGRSAIVIAMAADPSVEVIAIDPHAGNDRGPQQWDGDADDGEADHRTFFANLSAAGVASRVRHVRARSDDALGLVDGEVDMLYIDGSHRFAPARRDLTDWGARITQTGTMLVHDSYSSIGVTLALLTTTVPSRRWRYAGRSRSLTEYASTRLAGRDRLVDVARQLAPMPWFARNVAIKVLMTVRAGRLTRVLGHDGRTWPY
jgi:hypothetical protein